MSAYDYSKPLATAQRLIARYGRAIELQGASTGPADPSKPLGDRAPVAAPVAVVGAFVQPSSLNALGFGVSVVELFGSCSQIALVAPVNKGDDYSDMKFLYDNGVRWKIEHIETLKPGPIVVLHFIGVKLP